MKRNLYKHLAIAFGVIMLAGSCQNKGYEFPKAPEQVFLTEENMPPVEYFTLEKVAVPESTELDESYYVYADTLLFTTQSKIPSPYMLSVYNMKTQELVAGYFTKGRGPGELISIKCSFHKNELFAFDVTQNRVAILNVDSIALLKYGYTPAMVTLQGGTVGNPARYENDTLVAINDYHFYGFGCERVPEFLKICCSDGIIPESANIVDNVPLNINFRQLFYNKTTRQYVVAWSQFPYIDIFDENFNLQKQYVGPDNYMADLIVLPDFGNMIMDRDTTSQSFYAPGRQTENYIFYINRRFYGKRYHWETVGRDAEIFCFDSSLNLVRRLKQKDFTSTYFNVSYCEKSGNMYLNAEDEDGERCLYKCIFEK